MSKKNILIWLVVLLAVLNITTITTIVIHNLTENTETETVILDNDGQNMLNGRCMSQDVGFNEEQMTFFRNAKHEFQPKANLIIYKIDSLKNEMFVELNKNQSDTLILNNLSYKIGDLHAQLKKLTYGFYLSIKSTCNADQKEKLKQVFSPLFSNKPQDCRNDNGSLGKKEHKFRNKNIINNNN